MANPSPSSPPSQSFVLLLLLLVITSAAGGPSSPTDSRELSSTLEALRNHGYTLFTNAITTSDLQYQLLYTTAAADESGTLSSFTLFAPKDELLFALDMATDAAVYVNTLRYHIVPNHRYTFADLQNLSSPFVDTLLPHYAILVGKVLDDDVLFESATVGVMVDGIRVSAPDLFLGSRIAVHGIDGILLSGLNMNQDSGGSANGSGIFPPAESPATGQDRNIQAEEMYQFDGNNVPPAPASTFDGNIPSEGISTPISGFDRNNFPPAPASTLARNIPVEGTLAPTSQFDYNVPPSSASYFGGIIPASTFHGNIPAVGSPTPVTRPGALGSPPDGNIPVAAALKILHDRMQKLKNLAKKRGRTGRRHPRRHRAVVVHLLGNV